MITPYVKIDLNKVKSNIQFMIDHLKKNNISHRPHIKPHKSAELAKLQLDLGAIGVSCASLSELEVMVKGADR
jgi:D-serine deaminase-like pyridoxal phosphate-dependent protein